MLAERGAPEAGPLELGDGRHGGVEVFGGRGQHEVAPRPRRAADARLTFAELHGREVDADEARPERVARVLWRAARCSPVDGGWARRSARRGLIRRRGRWKIAGVAPVAIVATLATFDEGRGAFWKVANLLPRPLAIFQVAIFQNGV